ncbi:MAG: esterase-like activity of phytase family protein, partial [Clostridia bacterium]
KDRFKDAPLVPVEDVLPAVYSKRNMNRGFEGVTITPDGKWMFAAVQSPLANPDAKTAKASRVLRIIKIDLKTGEPAAEFAYLANDAKKFKGVEQYDIVISDLHAINEHTLLVDERDKNAGEAAQVKKIYRLDLKKATNVLKKYDDANAGKTLEQMTDADLRKAKVKLPVKRQIIDLTAYDYPFEKMEGLTMVDDKTVAIVNDNDFGIDNTTQTGTPTQFWLFELPSGLK